MIDDNDRDDDRATVIACVTVTYHNNEIIQQQSTGTGVRAPKSVHTRCPGVTRNPVDRRGPAGKTRKVYVARATRAHAAAVVGALPVTAASNGDRAVRTNADARGLSSSISARR